MGAHSSDTVRFQWDGFTDGGVAAPYGNYRIVADALINGSSQAVEVAVETRIESIGLNRDAVGTPENTILNLASGETVPLSTVQQIK